jgi:hypothetical protein
MNIPNRIKQSSVCCCSYCGKNYKSKTALEKHVVFCELINKSKKTNNNIEEEEIPSQKKMYKMLLELGQKYVKLETQIEEMNKFVVKKKKNINVLEWLNMNITPSFTFDNVKEKFIVTTEDIENLFVNNFNDSLNDIFSKTIYCMEEMPIRAFFQKPNTLYIYDKVENNYGWVELSREKLRRFLNFIELKISKELNEWKKKHNDLIRSNDKIAIIYDKTVVKIVSQDFTQEAVLNKIKNMIYSKIKTDMKTIIEYEFEF